MSELKQKSRVLVVEDDASMRHTFGRLLTLNGFDVKEAADGNAALEVIEDGNIDVVLSDIGIPGRNGIELLKAVGNTADNVPVILITGSADIDTAIAAVKGRAVAYLRKPCANDVILGEVRRAAAARALNREKQNIQEMIYEERGSAARIANKKLRLDKALEAMWLAFQPIVSAKDGRTYAFEALLRTDRELFDSPPSFLEEAAAQGRMRELAQRVRSLAAANMSQVPSGAYMFVNVLTADLLDDELYKAESPLSQHASRVVLELTEKESLEVVASSLKDKLQALRAMGYRIAVDDFGAGHSNVNSVWDIAPEIAKIDMLLCRGIEQSERKQQITKNVANLLRESGALVVAEGIETVAERDILRGFAIDLFQGYYFGKPDRNMVTPDPTLIERR